MIDGQRLDALIVEEGKALGLKPRSERDDTAGPADDRYRADGNYRVDASDARRDACDPNDPDPERARAEARRDAGRAIKKTARGDMRKPEGDPYDKRSAKPADDNEGDAFTQPQPGRKALGFDAADDVDPEAERAAMLSRETQGGSEDE